MSIKYIPLFALGLLAVIRVVTYPGGLGDKKSNDGFILPIVAKMNARIIDQAYAVLPSVHADLLLGMTIGVDNIKNDRLFYDNLVQIGLVHVVVVSGYNVALVIKFISGIFSDKLKTRNKFAILFAIILYTLVCGVQPPVVRAALMGYVSYLAMTEGRRIDCLSLIIFVCFIMVMIYPKYVVSLSFWLSVGATLGLVFFEPVVSRVLNSILAKFTIKVVPIFEDLSTSLACQFAVWPIISYFFGRVSIVSPLYNMTLLWLVPLCTVSGFIFILISQFLPVLSKLAGLVIFPFFDMFVRIVRFLASVDRGGVDFKLSLVSFVIYYLVLFLLARYLWRIETRVKK